MINYQLAYEPTKRLFRFLFYYTTSFKSFKPYYNTILLMILDTLKRLKRIIPICLMLLQYQDQGRNTVNIWDNILLSVFL